MQLLIIATALFGITTAAFSQYQEQNRPQAQYEKNARIIALESEVKEDSYRWNYETENGIKGQEQGQEANGIEAQGAFQYTGDDGQVYSISYSAGSNGFQPQGAHLPVPPPTPEAILKALEQNARDEAAGIIDDGQYNPGKYGGVVVGPAAPPAYVRPRAPADFRKPYKF